MKLSLRLLAFLARGFRPLFTIFACSAAPVASLATAEDAVSNDCNIVFIGDSITQGGYWSNTAAPTYRWHFFKIMQDQGINYNPIGTADYSARNFDSSTRPNLNEAGYSYKGVAFDYTHEASGSSTTYTWTGVAAGETITYNNNSSTALYPASRDEEDRGTVYNILGQSEGAPTGDAGTYYSDKSGTVLTNYGTNADGADVRETGCQYGEEVPEQLCLMIGINDLLTQATTSANDNTTQENAIANTLEIIAAYKKQYPDIKVTVMGLLPVDASKFPTLTPEVINNYNTALKAAVEALGDANVSYASVSAGLSSASNTTRHLLDGIHLGDQGQLLVAGNLAHAMGYGQRTLGLTAKAIGTLSHTAKHVGLTTASSQFSAGTGGSLSAATTTIMSTGAEAQAIILRSDSASAATLTLGSADGWDMSGLTNGYTLLTSLQMGEGSGALTLQFGDGTMGGALTISADSIYWGNMLLYSGAQTDMADYRIVYMTDGANAQFASEDEAVATGYYVWRNNQLIGEALAGNNTSWNANTLTLTSASGVETSAAIADISWDTSGCYSAATGSDAVITNYYGTLSLEDSTTPETPTPETPILVSPTGNIGSLDLTAAATWAAGTAPTPDETIEFTAGGIGLLSESFAVKGVVLSAKNVGVNLATGADAATTFLKVGSGGITVSTGGTNGAALSQVMVTANQTWTVAANNVLRIGRWKTTNNDTNTGGRLASDGLHQVTVTGDGIVVLSCTPTDDITQPEINWVVQGTLKAVGNSVGSTELGGLGTGTVTLDGGTLQANYEKDVAGGAYIQGSTAWGNDIIVGQNGGTVKLYGNAATNSLLLSGNISGVAGNTLTFSKSGSATLNTDAGIILAGDNSNYAGSVTVESGSRLRIGYDVAEDGSISSGSGGSFGSAGSSNTYTIKNGAHLHLAGTGYIQNSGVKISARPAANTRMRSGEVIGDLTNVVVTTTGISRQDETAAASVTNAQIDIADTYSLSNFTLTDSSVTMVSDKTLTVSGVTLAGSNTITLENTVAGGYTLINGGFAGDETATLTFAKGSDSPEQSAIRGFILGGDNSGFEGTMVIEDGVNLRVGANSTSYVYVGSASATYNKETGCLGTGAIVNNGTLTLTHGTNNGTVEWTLSNNISGTGALNVGDSSMNATAKQTVTLSGTNTYSGATNVAKGTLIVAEGGSIRGSSAYNVAKGANLKLSGSGYISNDKVRISARQAGTAAQSTEETVGVLSNVTVTETGISRVDATATASVTNAQIDIADTYSLSNFTLTDSSVIMVSDKTLTVSGVTLAGSNTITLENTEAGGYAWIKGGFTGDENATLTFAKGSESLAQSAIRGFILGGDNSGFEGTMVIEDGVNLRVGAAANDYASFGTGADSTGCLGAGDIVNNGTITLTHGKSSGNVSWELSNSISGTGSLNVGDTNISGTAAQIVTLSGSNTYSGATNVVRGKLIVTGSIGGDTSENTYVLENNAYLTLSGTGKISNKSVTIAAASSAKDGELYHLEVGTEGISKKKDGATIKYASIGITAEEYSISNVTFTDSRITGSASSSNLTLTDVTFAGNSNSISGVTVTGNIVGGGAANTSVAFGADTVLKLGGTLTGGELAELGASGLEGSVYAYDLSSLLSAATLTGTLTLDASALSTPEGYDHTVYQIDNTVNVSNLNVTLFDGKALSYDTTGFFYYAPAGTGGAIPEPTTATLSLLALSALAARRRRS